MSFTAPVELPEQDRPVPNMPAQPQFPGALQALGLLPAQSSMTSPVMSPQAPSTEPLTFQQHLRNKYPIAASILKLFA